MQSLGLQKETESGGNAIKQQRVGTVHTQLHSAEGLLEKKATLTVPGPQPVLCSRDLLVPSKTLKRHRCPTSQMGSSSLEGVRAMARAAQAERAQGTLGRQAGNTSPSPL